MKREPRNPIRIPTESDEKAAELQAKKDHSFYAIKKTKSGEFDSIIFQRIEFLAKLKSFGFYRYDLADAILFVRILNNRVKEVSDTKITDSFVNFLQSIDSYVNIWVSADGTEKSKLVTPEMLIEKLYGTIEVYFKKSLLYRLIPERPINVMTDSREKKYIFYQNGFVEITSNSTALRDYNQLQEFIWEDQILPRDYQPADLQKGYYERFINNVCGQDEERFLSMQTIIGYNLHNSIRGKLVATVLTDSRISEDGEANGRTGKTLWGKAIGHMLNANEDSTVYTELNGRDFDPRENTKYSACNINTALIHINDLKNKFNIENLFNDITEGQKVKKLYQNPFTLHAKLILSSNQTIIIEGESAKDRVIQFEFSDYYNSEKNPATEFGHWFFEDWDEAEWNRFDSFMIRCIQQYFVHGLVKCKEINLSIRTLFDHTAREFVNFMDDILGSGYDIPDLNNTDFKFKVIPGEKYEKSQFFTGFTRSNKDFDSPKFRQRSFTKWVRMYCKHKGVSMDEPRVNGKDYFQFK